MRGKEGKPQSEKGRGGGRGRYLREKRKRRGRHVLLGGWSVCRKRKGVEKRRVGEKMESQRKRMRMSVHHALSFLRRKLAL